jgi:hypothetical protein
MTLEATPGGTMGTCERARLLLLCILMRFISHTLDFIRALVVSIGVAACASGGPGERPAALGEVIPQRMAPAGAGAGDDAPRASNRTQFDSADPSANEGHNGEGSVLGMPEVVPNPAPAEEAFAIVEDATEHAQHPLFALRGEVVFALSPAGFLDAIDISNPTLLRTLDQRAIAGRPRQIYVRDETALVISGPRGEFGARTSSVCAFDVSKPSKLRELGCRELPGSVDTTQLSGDVLYLARYQTAVDCSDCESGLYVSAVDLTDSAALPLLAELTFSSSDRAKLTGARMYVITSSADGPGAVVRALDASDPRALRAGAALMIDGEIRDHAWLDETNGVLRIASSPARGDTRPRIQTFAVASADEVTALGELRAELPAATRLRDVHFDGTRGYLITEPVDAALPAGVRGSHRWLAFDLTAPDTPLQTGGFELPGSAYHAVLQDARVIGLGYDASLDHDRVVISLIDVSDLNNPRVLDSETFGGPLAFYSEQKENRDRPFAVHAEAGLLAIPRVLERAGGSGDAAPDCGGLLGGVQFVDWTGDLLELRGTVDSRSGARQTVMHGPLLIGIRDRALDAFDIADRSAPQLLGALPAAGYATRTVGLPDGRRLLRIAQGWGPALDIIPVKGASQPRSDRQLLVSSLPGAGCESGTAWLGDLALDGDRAYLVYGAPDPAPGQPSGRSYLATLDVSGDKPTLVASSPLDFAPGYAAPGSSIDFGRLVINVGSTLAIGHAGPGWGVAVIDARDPEALAMVDVPIPDGELGTGLIRSGSIVARSHYVPSAKDPARVAFYLDRIDISDPTAPRLLPAINIPGSLLHLDVPSGRAVTVDYRSIVETTSLRDCHAEHPNARFLPDSGASAGTTPTGRCVRMLYSLHLIALDGDSARLLGTALLQDHEGIGAIALGDNRLFAAIGTRYWHGVRPTTAYDDVAPYPPIREIDQALVVVAGTESGLFDSGRLPTPGRTFVGSFPIAARGDQVVISAGAETADRLSVIDTRDPATPEVSEEHQSPGWVRQLTRIGNQFVAVLGPDGLDTFSLE